MLCVRISVCLICILQLYSIHWLALVIFWWSLYGFLYRGSCLLQTVRVLLLFQNGFLLFLFLLCLLWPKLPKLCWIVMGKSGHPCLVPDFKGNAFNFSPLRIMFAVGLSYTAFIMLRYVQMLNFVKDFLWIYWDNHMVFIFQFVNVVYHIDWFVNIEESLHP